MWLRGHGVTGPSLEWCITAPCSPPFVLLAANGFLLRGQHRLDGCRVPRRQRVHLALGRKDPGGARALKDANARHDTAFDQCQNGAERLGQVIGGMALRATPCRCRWYLQRNLHILRFLGAYTLNEFVRCPQFAIPIREGYEVSSLQLARIIERVHCPES